MCNVKQTLMMVSSCTFWIWVSVLVLDLFCRFFHDSNRNTIQNITFLSCVAGFLRKVLQLWHSLVQFSPVSCDDRKITQVPADLIATGTLLWNQSDAQLTRLHPDFYSMYCTICARAGHLKFGFKNNNYSRLFQITQQEGQKWQVTTWHHQLIS